MKIAFHNRQRREPLDARALAAEFERLLSFLSDDLLLNPPGWMKKKQLKLIFAQGQISVAIVSDRAIRQVNRGFRQIDKATDVLSFPLELEPPPFFDMDSEDEQEEWVVGEVLISLEKAREQADEYGHTLARELSFLFVHGVLHVLGFDHMTAAEEKEMFGRQKRILAAAGIKRSGP